MTSHNTTAHPKVAIVGAGIGGLAAAIRLQAKGWQVEVWEQQESAGGKIGEWSSEGFRFDTGPSLFTLPGLVDELFQFSGYQPEPYFRYFPVKEGTRYFYEDGTILNPPPDSEGLATTIQEEIGEPAENVNHFLQESAVKYQITKPVFLDQSLHRLPTYLQKQTLQRLLRLPRIQPLQTMAQANQKAFKDPRVQQFFNRYATFNGSSPYAIPATFNVIPHLEHNIGAYFPAGGMYNIINSLKEHAERLGVAFYFGAPVKRIQVENKVATGLLNRDHEVFKYEAVVSNLDVHSTYRHLLPSRKAPKRFLQHTKSSSALIFYWGVEGTYESLGLHNILFAQDYQAEFTALFEQLTIPDDPTVYINISSKDEPSDAPMGCENWYVMINAPWNNGQNWDQLIASARHQILNKIYRVLGIDLTQRIVTEGIRDPRSLEAETGAYLGALYGNSSNNMMAAFMRHPNFSPTIKNLYFCGGTVHPGGGIPLCLLSAKIATELMSRDFSKQKA